VDHVLGIAWASDDRLGELDEVAVMGPDHLLQGPPAFFEDA
jgi:hypothetical protein